MSIHTFRPSLMPAMCMVCGADEAKHAYAVKTEPDVSPIRADLSSESVVDTSHAVARRTDPETSHAAARSVKNIRESQAEVLAVFRLHGWMTDEEAFKKYLGRQSVSGFRTRRSELVKAGEIFDTGETRKMSTGRRAVVWAARAAQAPR